MASTTEGSDGAFVEVIDPLASFLKDVLRTTGTEVFDVTAMVGNADKDGDGTLDKDEVHGAPHTAFDPQLVNLSQPAHSPIRPAPCRCSHS